MKAILHRFLNRLEAYFQRRIDARWQRAAEDAMRRRGRLNFGPPGSGTQHAINQKMIHNIVNRDEWGPRRARIHEEV